MILEKIDERALEKRIARINRKKDKIVIGITAGLIKTKGQQIVIKAMDYLRKDYNIVYELVGGGDCSYLRQVAKRYNLSDKVIFKGQLKHNEVLTWLDNLDIYIQPSLQEGLPRALVEAMSRACPAIGAKTAGIPELLMEKAVFESGSAKAIAVSLRSILSDDLYQHARTNFNKSMEYELEKLNKRREIIYKDYKQMVLNENN